MTNKTAQLECLEEKVHEIIERFERVRQEKQRLEAQLLKKDREARDIRKRLDAALRERTTVRQKIESIMQKIENLD